MINRLRTLIPNEGFWRDLTVVVSGTAIGQVISTVAAPALARLYTPSDFGTLAVYTSITTVVAAISTLSYQLAIPVPREDDEAARLTLISLLSVTFVAMLTACAVLVLRPVIASHTRGAHFVRYLPFLPLGILGLGSYETVTQWAARKKAFPIIARTAAKRSVIQVAAQLTGGVMKLSSLGLVVGQLLGQWSGSLTISRQAWREERANLRTGSVKGLLDTARAHKRFPLFTTPGVLVNVLDSNAAPLLFAYFFGATVTGYFALGHRLLSIPFMMIGNSAQKVFFPAAAKAHHQGTLGEETLRMFQRLAIIACPMVFLLSSSAPEVFAVILGKQWREAGTYVQWISLRTCFTLIVFPLMPLMYVLGKQALGTAFNLAQLVVRIGAICIGSLKHDAHLAVALLGAGTGVLWVGYLFYLMTLAGHGALSTLKTLARELVIAAGMASPIVVLKVLSVGDLPVTITAGVSTAVAAVIILKRLSDETPGVPVKVNAP